ncbi:unnamed protein product [Ambrosiozyma monospora]|uniref:Unnamed protein product n=1 Tax=Ambrosiozyma monospora TaxID=43982 RepID=A0A9W6YX41_AMBMO|nr:unnamed protein product [Ambrosiozyma monospora]
MTKLFFNHDLKTVVAQPKLAEDSNSKDTKPDTTIDYTEFKNKVNVLLGPLNISQYTIHLLYEKHVKSAIFPPSSLTDDLILRAVNDYFDNVKEYSKHDSKKSDATKAISDDDVKKSTRVNQKREYQEDSTVNVDLPLEKKPRVDEPWERFIGSLQVDCWCTRSVFGQSLTETTEIHLSKRPDSNTMVYVNLTSQRREIGRCNEDIAKIVGPLLQFGFVRFKPFFVYTPTVR